MAEKPLKFVCRDCGFYSMSSWRLNITQCPQCDSKNVEFVLISSPSRQGEKSKIFGNWCCCLLDLLVPLILLLIIFLAIVS